MSRLKVNLRAGGLPMEDNKVIMILLAMMTMMLRMLRLMGKDAEKPGSDHDNVMTIMMRRRTKRTLLRMMRINDE